MLNNLTTEELYEGSVLTAERVLADLETLRAYCDELELETMVIPPMEEVQLPVLAAILENDEQERPRVVTCTFVPVDSDLCQYTKQLQFYLELQNSLEGVSRAELLELIMWINVRINNGTCLLRESEQDHSLHLAVRLCQGFRLDDPVDPVIFGENLMMFDEICEIVSSLADLMAGGKSFAEIAALQQEQ